MSMTELPFGLKGKIFRSPMPFGTYDEYGQVFQEYKSEDISVVVPLAGREECEQKTGRKLFDLYLAAGYEIISLPIADFEATDEDVLRDCLQKVIAAARTGKHVVVHCSAGIGRTGMFMACMAKTVLDMPADEAIRWVRSYIPGAVETVEQEEFIQDFKPTSQ